MQPMYELTAKCNKTEITEIVEGPYYSLEKINEEKELYERYAPPNVTFTITNRGVVDYPLSFIEKICVDDTTHNPFDSTFKIPDDVNERESSDYVGRSMIMCSQNVYNKGKDITPCIDLMDSLWFTGFINVLFDGKHCDYMHKVWEWIATIGKTYDPNVLDSIKGSHYRGPYTNGLYVRDVRRISKYCQQIFGVNKYEVAEQFITREVPKFEDIHFLMNDAPVNANEMSHVAAIYAERGDIKMARKSYLKALTFSVETPWENNYLTKLERFDAYVEQHGTSVLSSSD